MFCSRAAKISARMATSGDLQLLHEPVEQLGGAGVGVGLEGAPPAARYPMVLGGGEQGVELVGVVGVVVVDLRPVDRSPCARIGGPRR